MTPHLSPAHYTRHPKYDYVLQSDLVLRADRHLGSHDFQDEFGEVWLEVRGATLTVKKGYAWDGASCAPDFKDAVVASCVHDACVQFLEVPCFPLSKAEVDAAFRKLMPGRFALRWVYWAAVRAFGGVYAAALSRPSTGSCGLRHLHK